MICIEGFLSLCLLARGKYFIEAYWRNQIDSQNLCLIMRLWHWVSICLPIGRIPSFWSIHFFNPQRKEKYASVGYKKKRNLNSVYFCKGLFLLSALQMLASIVEGRKLGNALPTMPRTHSLNHRVDIFLISLTLRRNVIISSVRTWKARNRDEKKELTHKLMH